MFGIDDNETLSFHEQLSSSSQNYKEQPHTIKPLSREELKKRQSTALKALIAEDLGTSNPDTTTRNHDAGWKGLLNLIRRCNASQESHAYQEETHADIDDMNPFAQSMAETSEGKEVSEQSLHTDNHKNEDGTKRIEGEGAVHDISSNLVSLDDIVP